jgi:hypothetical protein
VVAVSERKLRNLEGDHRKSQGSQHTREKAKTPREVHIYTNKIEKLRWRAAARQAAAAAASIECSPAEPYFFSIAAASVAIIGIITWPDVRR